MKTLRSLSFSTLFLFLISVSTFSQALYNPEVIQEVEEDINDALDDVTDFKQDVRAFKEEINLDIVNDGFSFRIWLPGFLFRLAAWFIPIEEEPELKAILKKVGSISVMVKEGHKQKKRFDRKFNRLANNAELNGFSELMTVVSNEAKVKISAKTNKRNIIKKLLITVSTDDTFVMLKANGQFDLNEIAHLAQSADW